MKKLINAIADNREIVIVIGSFIAGSIVLLVGLHQSCFAHLIDCVAK